MREASLSKPSNKPLLLNIIMWQTKSAVQPRGPMDEWQRFTGFCEGSRSVRQWADNGKAHSALRPGEVSASAGPQGYRHLMTEVDLSLAD